MNRIRKILIALLIVVLVGVGALFAYGLVAPQITVSNVSDTAINEAIITLPASRVVFGSVEPGDTSTIYHDVQTPEGAYHYQIILAHGTALSGQCGYLVGANYGKRLEIVVQRGPQVSCRESNKIF